MFFPPRMEDFLMKNTVSTVRIICEIGVIAALGFVFDELQGILFKGVFPNGGSIGFAMVVVLVMAFRRGFLPAILTGLLMGLLDIATSAYILHPAQLLLDYILPYAVVGLVGLLRPLYVKSDQKSTKIMWLALGALIGGMLKFLSHYLAGVIFWANPEDFAWNLTSMNPYLYCFIYNIAFIGPSIILSGGLLIAMYLMAPQILNDQPIISETKVEKKNIYPYVISSFLAIAGTAVFVIFLVRYIQSFESYEDGSAFGYDFDPDSLILFVLGLFVMVLGINALIASFLKKFSYLRTSLNLLSIVTASLIYGIARLIRMYVKEKDPTQYWIWFGVGVATLAICGTFFALSLMKYIKSKKEPKAIQEAN